LVEFIGVTLSGSVGGGGSSSAKRLKQK